MRRSPLLLQIAAAAAAKAQQRNLPLPNIYPTKNVPRLTPKGANYLPSLINAPTTIPPTLMPPEKFIEAGFLFATGRNWYYKLKSYYIFYKAGMKQFNHNRKARKVLKNKLMESFKFINIPGSATIVMSRSEFQMMIRTKRDWRKMPMFGVVALVFGEFTPIIIWLLGTWFLPGTVITGRQLDRRRRLRMDVLDRKKLPVIPRVTPTVEQVKKLDRRTVILYGVFSRRLPLFLLPTPFLREMLIRQVNYLEYDDELIRQSARPDLEDMHIGEVKWALEERGVSLYTAVPVQIHKTGLVDKPDAELRQLLRIWLKLNENKHPNQSFRHEQYLSEMIRYSRLPDL